MTPNLTWENWTVLLRQSPNLTEAVDRSIFATLRPYVEADEIVHDTMRYAFEHPEQWKAIPEKELIFYLRRVALSQISNRARRVKTSLRVLQKKEAEAESVTPSRILHQQEKISATHRILDRISSPHQREVLKLVFLKGMKSSEVAKKTGRTAATISILLKRAMENCRKIARRASFDGFRISGVTH